MKITYYILLTLGILAAVVFSFIVLMTGKGDAMSGGSSGIRTTFKGRQTIEDKIGRMTLFLGGAFMLIMLALDWLGANGAFN